MISTPIRIGDREWAIEVTLTNRDAMSYRMLLGRQAISGGILVDPASSFRQPRLRYKLYEPSRSPDGIPRILPGRGQACSAGAKICRSNFREDRNVLTLYYAPGACSLAAHIVLEESGEKYEAKRVDFSKGEQRTESLSQDQSAGSRAGAAARQRRAADREHGDPALSRQALRPVAEGCEAEARALSLIGFFAASVHPAHAHIRGRSATPATSPSPTSRSRAARPSTAPEADRRQLAGRQWFSDAYSVLDPYAFTFYTWGVRREMPMAEMKNYTAHKDRMLPAPPSPRRRGREGQGVIEKERGFRGSRLEAVLSAGVAAASSDQSGTGACRRDGSR